MEDRKVELFGVVQMDNGTLEQFFIGTILGPTQMPPIHVRPMEFVTNSDQGTPRHAGMKDIEDIIENTVASDLELWPACSSRKMPGNVMIETFQADRCWEFGILSRRVPFGFVAHGNVLIMSQRIVDDSALILAHSHD